MIDRTNYYFRLFEEIEDRADFVYYHPKLDAAKAFRNSGLSFPFGILVKDGGVDYGITESGKDEGTYEFVNIQNLGSNGLIDKNNIKYVDKVPPEKFLKADQILISRSRLVGRASKVTDEFEDATFGSYIIRFELEDDVDYEIDFLIKFINCRLGQEQITLLKTGSAGENINSRQLMDIRLPKVERRQQQYVMQQAKSVESQAEKLEGEVNNIFRLVDKRFLEELGILGTIKSNNFDYYTSSIGGFGRLDFEFNSPKYDIIDALIANSKVQFVELREVVDFLQDSDDPTEYPDKEFLYADIGNVDTKWGQLNPVIMKGKDARSSRMRRIMYADNILVSTTRPTRNAIAIVPKELDKQICSTGFAVLKCKPTMNNRFLFHALRTQLSNLEFARHCSGSGYPAINQETDLPHIKVPLPLLDDQLKVVGEIDKVLQEAREMELESNSKWGDAKALFENMISEKERDF